MTFRLRNVQYKYPRAAPGVSPALSLESLDLPSGGVVALLGMSGSGKTTLLSTLGLLLEVQLAPGQVIYESSDGSWDYHRLPPRAQAAFRRDRFGFVLQSSYLLPQFSCLDNIRMALALRGRLPLEKQRAEVERVVQHADPSGKLQALLGRSPRDVSGGERQRIAVLRAVVHDPDVLFADEPFSSLDPVNAEAIRNVFRLWLQGKLHGDSQKTRTLLLVSHALETALDFAEEFGGGRCALLRSGQVVQGRLLNRTDFPNGARDIERLIRPAQESA